MTGEDNMCGNPFSSPSIPTPPPDLTGAAQRKKMREDAQAQRSAQKEEDLKRRVQAAYSTSGRGSLLSGRKGGQGFEVKGSLMSKDTLGA